MSPVYVRARVGAERYAFRVDDVSEVTVLGAITPVPGAPASVLGVRNLRGQVLPVLDLGAVLGVARTGDRGKLVVAEQRGLRAGLAVDELEDVGELPGELEPTDSPYLDGAVLADGRLIGMVDVGKVMRSADTVEGLDGA